MDYEGVLRLFSDEYTQAMTERQADGVSRVARHCRTGYVPPSSCRSRVVEARMMARAAAYALRGEIIR
jgi:hypothetical protein